MINLKVGIVYYNMTCQITYFPFYSIKHNKPGECLTSASLSKDYQPMAIAANLKDGDKPVMVNYTYNLKFIVSIHTPIL